MKDVEGYCGDDDSGGVKAGDELELELTDELEETERDITVTHSNAHKTITCQLHVIIKIPNLFWREKWSIATEILIKKT